MDAQGLFTISQVNLSRINVEGTPAYPNYPGGAHISYVSLQNSANRLHERQKRRPSQKAKPGHPFYKVESPFQPGLLFLHINTLARLAGSTQSRRDIQSMRERCWLKGSSVFSYKRSLKSTRPGGLPSSPGQLFYITTGP